MSVEEQESCVGINMASTFLYTVLLFPATRAKYAIGAIKKKLNDKNPHVALYALEVSVVYLQI